MKKKILSLVLTICMVLTMIPVTAFAAPPATGVPDGFTEIGTSTDGTFTDNQADPTADYEYLVVDNSTGKQETVQVKGNGGTTSETGNKVVENPSTEAKYVKVTDLNTLDPNKTYILGVIGKNNKVSTIKSDLTVGNASYVPASGELTGTIDVKDEWTVKYDAKAKTITLQNSKGSYLNINKTLFDGVKVGLDTGKQSISCKIIQPKSEMKLYKNIKVLFSEKSYYINVGTSGKPITAAENKGSDISFFEKQTSQNASWTVDTTGLDALIASADKLAKDKDYYTQESWNIFETALSNAKATKEKLSNSYVSVEEANTALAEINSVHNELQNAMNALVKVNITKVEPEITWERTLEPKRDDKINNKNSKLVTKLPHIEASGNFDIVWDWDKVKNLTTNKNMTVWDYGTSEQYSNVSTPTGNASVLGATWNEWDETEKNSNWKDSSVRLFHGEFIWPEGYDFNDKIVVTSANDSNYQPIYEYINNNPKLKARYGDKKIVAINDTMYLFISKADDSMSTWTKADAGKHLAFWSGSDGKGVWSSTSNTNGDWGRKTPASFAGEIATPAFNKVYPNNKDIDNSDTPKALESSIQNNMLHTDGWYSFISPETLMDRVQSNYSITDVSGQKMAIDILCFDNSGSGGMDKLKIEFVKRPVEEVKVTVKYYLNEVSGTPLKEATKTAKVGDEIVLEQGTLPTELNYGKASAYIAAGADSKVADGIQIGGKYIVHEGTDNVINVIYRSVLTDTTYYTYDFGVDNKYVIPLSNTVETVSVENTEIKDAKVGSDRKSIEFTYKPKDALGKAVNATFKCTVKTSEGESVKNVPITIIPASNVLYEEDYFNAPNDNTWVKGDINSNITVSDNESTVFGYTDSYKTSTGQFGGYTSNITDPDNGTGDLTIDFTGRGFDLIGSCGPNTGLLAVKLLKDNVYVKGYIVDTIYNDSSIGEIFQVPLIHENGLESGTYKLVIAGFGDVLSDVAPVSTYSLNDGKDTKSIHDIMLHMGFTEEEMDSVEIIGYDDIMGASTYALESEEINNNTKATEKQEIQQVTIDALRVYRTSSVGAGQTNPYQNNEQDMVYTNVMDDGITGNLVAYVEPSKTGETTQNSFDITEYEAKGGPENEIYLAPNQGVAFTFEGTETAPQISARRVNGTGSVTLSDGINDYTINHNTEMYYKIATHGNKITLINKGTGILALGNIKSKSAVKALSSEQQAEIVKTFELMANGETIEPDVPDTPEVPEIPEVPDEPEVPEEPEVPSEPEVPEIPEEPETPEIPENPDMPEESEKPEEIEKVFTPERFDVDIDVHKFFGKKNVNLTIKTSKDVEYIIVDGKKYKPSKNRWGRKSDTKTFKISKKFSKNDTVQFEVNAYNKDELGSYTYVVEENSVTIKEANVKALKEAKPLEVEK